MSNVVARLPEPVLLGAREVAAIQGRQFGEVISDAWELYMNSIREEMVKAYERRAKRLRNGDIAGFANQDGSSPWD